MAISDRFSPHLPDGVASALPVRTPVELTADGAITIAHGTVFLNKAGVLAATLDTPPTDMDGCTLKVIAATANAHTITQTTPGFNGGGTASDVATFGGAKGDSIELVGYGGVWYVSSVRNVTLG